MIMILRQGTINRGGEDEILVYFKPPPLNNSVHPEDKARCFIQIGGSRLPAYPPDVSPQTVVDKIKPKFGWTVIKGDNSKNNQLILHRRTVQALKQESTADFPGLESLRAKALFTEEIDKDYSLLKDCSDEAALKLWEFAWRERPVSGPYLKVE